MKKVFKSLLTVSCSALCALGLTSCGSDEIFNANKLGVAKQATSLTYEERKSYSHSFINAAAEKFASEFASLAYSEYNKDKNFVVSPISVYMAMSLAAQCADGQTQNEILSLLGVTYEQLLSGFSDFYRSIYSEYYFRSDEDKNQLSGIINLSNSIWIDTHATYKQDCIDVLSDRFYCNSFSAEFKDNNQEANKSVRKFVKDNTRGLIDRDFRLSDRTSFALINTLYLKDIWSETIKELSSTDREYSFTKYNGEVKNVKLLEGYYNYGRAYKEEQFITFFTETLNGNRINFILPEGNFTVKDVFTTENINKIKALKDYNGVDHDKKERYYTRCLFPEFSASYDEKIGYLIQKMGVNLLFDENNCSFANLTDDQLYCSDVIHAAELKVNRRGIEGAAVTVLELCGSAGPDGYEEIYEDFVIDRAFGFLISDRYGNTLFSGVVENI